MFCTLLTLIGVMGCAAARAAWTTWEVAGGGWRVVGGEQARWHIARHHSYAGAAPATLQPPSGHLLPGAGRRPGETPAPLRCRPECRSALERVFPRGPPPLGTWTEERRGRRGRATSAEGPAAGR